MKALANTPLRRFPDMLLASVREDLRTISKLRCNERQVAVGSLLFCWLLLLCFCQCAHALDPRKGLGDTARQVWSTENGLPQNSVHAILQTADGYLWVGTEGGLARFDGYQFRVFDPVTTPGMEGSDVRCLLQDRTGTLWVGTALGLSRIRDGVASSFGVADGLAAGAVRTILQSADGRLWVLTDGGLAVSQADTAAQAKTRFRSIAGPGDLAHADVLALANDAGDGIWLGTTAGLYRISSAGVVAPGPAALLQERIDVLAQGTGSDLLISGSNGVVRLEHGTVRRIASGSSLPVGGVRSLVETKEGIWAIGRDAASLITSSGVKQISAGHELPGTQITAAFVDQAGATWFGTNAGVAREWKGRIERASGAGEAESAAVLSLGEDRDGDILIGTETAGLEMLRARIFAPLSGSPSSTDHPATSLLQAPGGSIWVGTNGAGVVEIGPSGARTFTSTDGLASNTVLALAAGGQDAGDVWVGTPDGLSEYHEGRWKVLTSADGLVDDLVRSLLVTRDGAVWIGSRHGLTRWQSGHGRTLTRADGLGSDLVGPMLETKDGDLWVGTSGGLTRLHTGQLKTYTTSDGLPGDVIGALEPANGGGFWIAVEGQGLARWTGSGFVSFASVAAIPRDINALVDDGLGSLWMSSRRGIFRVPIADLIRRAGDGGEDVPVISYGPADGLAAVQSGGVGYPSAGRLAGGYVGFATRRGVMSADTGLTSRAQLPPKVTIEEVSIDGREMAPKAVGPVAPGSSHFVFTFAGIELAAPQHVQYRYMMQGLDDRWVDAGTRRTAYYTNIPHGRYVFRVCARNAGGPWSDALELPIEVRPHLYETGWFRALLVLCVVLFGLAIYRLRLRTLRGRFAAVSAERIRLAREIHDTLAQSFVAVSVRLEVMSQMLRGAQGVEACREQLDETRALVRDSLAEARRSIWDLRSEGEESQSLPARLSTLVQQARKRMAEVELVTTGTYRPLERRTEDELFRIAQEAVSNVVRHAQAESMHMSLQYGLGSVSLEVRDTGRGFDPESVASRREGHFGLTGIRERARILRADVMLESEPGSGTRLRVTVPLPRGESGDRG